MKKKPILRRHKASGRAYIWDGDRRIYFGKWGAPETAEKYRRYLLDLDARGLVVGVAAPATVAELFARVLTDRAGYYRAGSRYLDKVKSAASYILPYYATTPARDFRPSDLRKVRFAMLDGGRLSRSTINEYIHIIGAVFKYGVSVDLIPPEIVVGLSTVESLRRGRSTAREPSPRRPVAPDVIDRTITFLPPTIADVVQLLRLSGMRPSEVLAMRRGDFSRDDSGVLVYTLRHDKTDYKRADGSRRRVFLGARAERILAPYLAPTGDESPDAFLFTCAALRLERKLDRERRPHADARRAGDCAINAKQLQYEIDGATRRAGVEHWTAYQIRHTFATDIRRRYGLEAAQVMLGHSRADVTQIYAERDDERAREIARRDG